MIKKSIKDKIKQYPNLYRYAVHFDKTEGENEKAGYLPFLVVWLRELFNQAGIDDDQVPELFDFDEYETEEFFSWGHNSRYNHVFAEVVAADINFCLEVTLDIMRDMAEAGEQVIDTDAEKRILFYTVQTAIKSFVRDNYGQSEVENPSWDIDALADYVVDKIKE